MLTNDKITVIVCITNEFCKKFNEEVKKLQKLPENAIRHRNRPCDMSGSEIITVLLPYHFGDFKNFKHFYLHFIRVHLQKNFPKALSYSRFIQLEPRCFMPVMFFPHLECLLPHFKCLPPLFKNLAKRPKSLVRHFKLNAKMRSCEEIINLLKCPQQ